MIYKKKKQSLPDRMLNILFKFYFMHEVTSMIWIPLQILCVAEMSAAWPVSILTSSLLTQSVYCWQQQCATATYNSFPLIDRFSNLEKKMISREIWGGKKIFHWQAILLPFSFSSVLCLKRGCDGWSCNRQTSFNHKVTVKMEAT